MTITARPLAPGELDHELVWSSIALVSLAGLAMWVRLPDAPAWPCVFRLATGIPCVTCGGTRAMLALLSGDVAAALRWNPLVATAGLAGVPYVVYAVTSVVFGLPRVKVSLCASDWRAMRVASVAAIVLTWAFLIVDGR